MKRKAILFDCGDTLVHLDPPREKIVLDFLHEEGVNIAISDVKLAYRIANFCLKQSSLNIRSTKEKQDFFITYNMQLFKILGLSSKAESWAEKLLEKFTKYRRWVPFSDIDPALRSLKLASFSLGVVANWDSGLSDLLEQLSISQLFTVILSSAEVGIEKPAPEIFLLAMERIGTSSNGTYYAGNEYEIDVIGARGAGIKPILIDRDNALPYADCLRFPSLREMATYLIDTQRGDKGAV